MLASICQRQSVSFPLQTMLTGRQPRKSWRLTLATLYWKIDTGTVILIIVSLSVLYIYALFLVDPWNEIITHKITVLRSQSPTRLKIQWGTSVENHITKCWLCRGLVIVVVVDVWMYVWERERVCVCMCVCNHYMCVYTTVCVLCWWYAGDVRVSCHRCMVQVLRMYVTLPLYRHRP